MTETGVSAKVEGAWLAFPDMTTVSLDEQKFTAEAMLFGFRLKSLVGVIRTDIREVAALPSLTGVDLRVEFHGHTAPLWFCPKDPQLWVTAFKEQGIEVRANEPAPTLTNKFGTWYFRVLPVLGTAVAAFLLFIIALLLLRGS
jgi:hypothetical protein